MEGLWCVLGHWRPNGHCHVPHSHVVHVYFFPHPWFSHYYLHGAGVLDEHEALYFSGEEKSIAVLVSRPFS